MKDDFKMDKKKSKKSSGKTRPRCVVCNKFLKVFERNLCSCKLNVCMKHKQRLLHECPDSKSHAKNLVKVVAPKVIRI